MGQKTEQCRVQARQKVAVGECINWESGDIYSPIQLDSTSMHNSKGEAGATD